MKVLHVLSSHDYNGAENVACQIIKMFDGNQGCEMFYCSTDGSIREFLDREGINYFLVRTFNVAAIKNIIKHINPDIIHAHDMKASLISALSCGNKRLISHIHNNAYASRRISIKSILYTVAAKKAEHIFWVSDEAMNGYVFKNMCVNKSSVLKNVVDPVKVRRLADEDINEYGYDAIYVGRMEPEKDPERFVRICCLIKKQKPNFRAAMVGTGELEQQTKELCKVLKLNDTIDFLGYMQNPYKIMKCSKVIIMPSKWEGMPMVQLEAECLGTPVVRTPATDEELAERALEYVDGKLVCCEIENDISSYKKAIEKSYGIIDT